MEIRGVVHRCTKIPLDTPLARLVTVDPSVEVIEHDLRLLHMWNGSNPTIVADSISSISRCVPCLKAVGDTAMPVSPVHHEQV